MDATDWHALIEANRPDDDAATFRAETLLRVWGSASRPALVRCDGGRDFVVKGRQNGRMIVNERIVGLLGQAMGAPVPDVALVEMPAELIEAQPELGHFQHGMSHGSAWIDGATEQEGVSHTDLEQNRSRFCRLAILYGLVLAADIQFIYRKQPPHEVHSVDHGHFFPGGPDWNEAGLQAAPDAEIDPQLVAACQFTDDEKREEMFPAVKAISDLGIASAIGRVPLTWGLGDAAQVALAGYLARRRDRLISLLDPGRGGTDA